MTRDEAELVAGLVRAEFPVWMINGRSVVISVECERGWEAADGWYVRIDKSDEEE